MEILQNKYGYFLYEGSSVSDFIENNLWTVVIVKLLLLLYLFDFTWYSMRLEPAV